MFFQKLLKNRTDIEPEVYASMKNIDAEVQENGNSVIIIDDQVDTTNVYTEQVCVYIYTHSSCSFFFSLYIEKHRFLSILLVNQWCIQFEI